MRRGGRATSVSGKRPATSSEASSVYVAGSLDEVREEWVRLAEESRNIFSTWEWASTWWHRYGEAQQPLVAACLEGQHAVALLPLYVWSRRSARIARFIGHGPADQLGPVCGTTARTTAADGLRRVAEREGIDLILAELLPGGEGWREALGQDPILVESSPALSLDGGWLAYLAQRSGNLRQQIRRRERQLHSRHAVRFRLTTSPSRLQDDLTLLFALHGARWGTRSAFSRFEPFHRDFAAVALERGWLRLWFLELDERPAAAWYGFRFAGVESYYQAGRDVALREESVGFVLLAHSIREAAEEGMHEYRLLRGAESFKLRFADGDPGLETFGLARGIRGRAARAGATVGLRSAGARAALRRIAGRSEH
jgi:CelD/BcsL family acetyltransferase involved in cellulose biosynthesis